jgi:hypothetical protein
LNHSRHTPSPDLFPFILSGIGCTHPHPLLSAVKCITCSLPALQTPRVTSACGPRNLKLRRPTVYPASIFADEEKRPARWVKMLAHEPCRRVCSVMRSFTWRRCRNPADFKEMLEGPIVRDPRRHKPSRHAAYPEQSGKVLVARLQVSCPSVRLRHSVGRASTRGAMDRAPIDRLTVAVTRICAHIRRRRECSPEIAS